MYHKPVLLTQAVDLLDVRPAGTYVDATFGSGGHSGSILERLGQQGRLIAFDQDEDALQNILSDDRFLMIRQNFRFLKNYLKINGITSVDGVLADLGISSWQIDIPERGFSTRFEGRLDMRMDRQQDLDAEQVINEYPQEDLANVFYRFGELQNSRRLAAEICIERKAKRIRTTAELSQIASRMAPRGKENQYLARVFQSIRIEVNEELEALKNLLRQATDMLSPGGRLIIISYHSLEDKLVKNFFNTGNFDGKAEKDFYGNLLAPLAPIYKKAIQPDQKEMDENPRSRSAKLRAAKKNT